VSPSDPESGALRSLIEAEIARRGPIPFARFMELCLYHPRHGYYTRGLGGGGGRDYLTSSGVHEAFGILVARQAEEMWHRAGRPERFFFVEFGPGEGRFAADFLQAAGRSRGGFARALRYLLVEPSPVLQARQRARLQGRTLLPVEWVAEDAIERRKGFEGVIFANEVLDAFPVHRLVGTPEGPREVHVDHRDGRLIEVMAPPSSEAVGRFMAEAGVVLEDGQEADLNLAAPCWIAWAIGLLARGYLLVIDYGHEARELYHPARRRGTLLAYHRHRTSEAFLGRPGEQDLTAHLDFTALQRAAEQAGGRCLGLTTQARFLLALGALDLLGDPVGAPGPGREGEAVDALRRHQEREALKDLVLPERMGDRFRVLVLGAGEVTRDLRGLSEPWTGSPGAVHAGPAAPGRGVDGTAGHEVA